MRGVLTLAILACIEFSLHADILFAPGDQIIVTFTAKPNTRDLLFFYMNGSITVSGTPTFSTSLYNGGTLTGTLSAPPLDFGGENFLQALFEGAGATLVYPPSESLVVDFSSINNGTINGKVVTTISDGSIVSADDFGDFEMFDALSNGNGYTVGGDITVTSRTLIHASQVPEPSTLGLLTVLLALIVADTLRRTSGSRSVQRSTRHQHVNSSDHQS